MNIILSFENFIFKVKRYLYKRYNKMLFYSPNITTGKNFIVHNKIYLRMNKNSHLTIGDNFLYNSGDFFNPIARNIRGGFFLNDNSQVFIGNNVGISCTCIWSNLFIKIGDRVKIGADTIIMDTDAHSLNYLERRNDETDGMKTQSKPIVIEDDVLIGTRCIILKGVHIGARSIIGSGSIVTKDIPSDSIAAGNPCKVLKKIENDKQ